MPDKPILTLASQSPRRRDLLDQVGIRYRVQPVDIDETPTPGEAPDHYVRRLAESKARTAWSLPDCPRAIPVLAADTAVVLDGRILGKPADRGQAGAMLESLSGRRHEVMTAVSVCSGAGLESRIQTSRVSFAKLSLSRIERYLASGEADDKAGAYAIQGLGAAFVSELQGSYSGVVGLPLFETLQLLEGFGIELPL